MAIADSKQEAFSNYYTSLMITSAGLHSIDNLRHMVRTSFLISKMMEDATWMPFGSDEQSAIIRAAAFHDIGKLFIPNEILNKPCELALDEFEIMKQHTKKGAQFVGSFRSVLDPLFASYLDILCRSHHERWDGTGYPDGLVGGAIPYPARLLAVVDVYDALTHDRPYRPAMTHDDALKIIHQGKETHFDPDLVERFDDIIKSTAFMRLS